MSIAPDDQEVIPPAPKTVSISHPSLALPWHVLNKNDFGSPVVLDKRGKGIAVFEASPDGLLLAQFIARTVNETYGPKS